MASGINGSTSVVGTGGSENGQMGTVFTTLTYAGGSKSGTYSECAFAFMDNGTFSTALVRGSMRLLETQLAHSRLCAALPMAAGTLQRVT
jgi:hypothetical protein